MRVFYQIVGFPVRLLILVALTPFGLLCALIAPSDYRIDWESALEFLLGI